MSIPIVGTPKIPSVTIFVRHSADCPHKENESYRRCQCRKHLRWSYGGKQFRKSAKTRSWQAAEDRRRDVEAQFQNDLATGSNGDVALQSETKPTIEDAIGLFIKDKRSQGLDEGFLKRYQRELGRMSEFMMRNSILFPHEIEVQHLTEFRAGWNTVYQSSVTRSKVQERLRAFLRYCFNARMIDRIPKLSPIKVTEPPTMPLSDSEYDKFVGTIHQIFTGKKAKRLCALVRLMRWTGLAIQDAVTLRTSALKQDTDSRLYRIETYRQKTGVHVSVPIQPHLAKELLDAVRINSNPKYFFWSGNGKIKTALSDRGNDLRSVFRLAGFADGHPHQLRDTFAVSLLGKGVPIEEVSKLLGHESIRTTERDYAKWVKSRQDRLDKLVTATWKSRSSKKS